jgi:hypothetical protein
MKCRKSPKINKILHIFRSYAVHAFFRTFLHNTSIKSYFLSTESPSYSSFVRWKPICSIIFFGFVKNAPEICLWFKWSEAVPSRGRGGGGEPREFYLFHSTSCQCSACWGGGGGKINSCLHLTVCCQSSAMTANRPI